MRSWTTAGAGTLIVALLLTCSDDSAQPPDAAADAAPPADALASDAPASDAAPWTCPSYAAPAKVGTVTDSAINETSGLAASAKNPGVLWLHNDSGDTARVFAIDQSGALRGTYALGGATAQDWEDMTLGPGPQAGTSYLYLGDIGDNPATRASIAVYRVPEPDVPASGAPATATLSGVETLSFVYPDGAHNAETLLIDPHSGDLYIVTKMGSSPAGIYRSPAPQSPGSTRTLTSVGTVSLGGHITGGDIAADRSEVLLRTYVGAHLWRWPAGQTLADALAVSSCSVPAASEPQGEAIAFAPGSKDYYTLSEGLSQPLYRQVRQ